MKTETSPPVTIPSLQTMKREGSRIAALTAYDFSFARIMDRAGMDIILVGDTLGMVVQGHETTLPVTVDQMIYHAQAVTRATSRALVVVDLPFLSFSDESTAVESAGRVMKESGARMVKLEGTHAQARVVQCLAGQGIPVCAHVGLMPQSVHKLGGYRIQGRDEASSRQVLESAVALQDAGADLMLVECIPAALAEEITRTLRIPVIGIGAGAACDGQILVLYDLLGITESPPSFARDFLAGSPDVAEAVETYVREVKAGRFPGADETIA